MNRRFHLLLTLCVLTAAAACDQRLPAVPSATSSPLGGGPPATTASGLAISRYKLTFLGVENGVYSYVPHIELSAADASPVRLKQIEFGVPNGDRFFFNDDRGTCLPGDKALVRPGVPWSSDQIDYYCLTIDVPEDLGGATITLAVKFEDEHRATDWARASARVPPAEQ